MRVWVWVWVRDRYRGCGDEGGEEEDGKNESVCEHHGSSQPRRLVGIRKSSSISIEAKIPIRLFMYKCGSWGKWLLCRSHYALLPTLRS